ncbi:uncharacterized protein LOC107003907 isoform X1 [Solanum pennellii]|uniref:Uncharacterized protein LOC107003907 isoform X1 n=2 Tax=Solanum pennellii TaxID=28526 RepID=A0ABM1UYQ0_SOLPN|nr:uncharacterized protein LOC107003907 isoform X1 [Solanum pennellii]
MDMPKFGKRFDMERGILHGMKSHDSHVFMEQLLPMAEISLFFKDLCSSTLRTENLVPMAENIVFITNKLEKILPPGFFDVMEHLPIHLVGEALLGGLVQYRWVYPFERSIGKSKRGMKNKHRVEGCMIQVYLAKERSHFFSYYFDDYVSCLRNRPNRHDDTENDLVVKSLSIFNQPGKDSKSVHCANLPKKEKKSAELHVLLNYPEVQPFLDYCVSQYGHDQVFTSFILWYTNWKMLTHLINFSRIFLGYRLLFKRCPNISLICLYECVRNTIVLYLLRVGTNHLHKKKVRIY